MPLHLFSHLVAGALAPLRVASLAGPQRPAPLATGALTCCSRRERTPMDSLGSRLRYERERRQISLKSIAESTKIGITLLEGLERDDVSRWPSGIFRKSFIQVIRRSHRAEARFGRSRVRRTVSRSAGDPTGRDTRGPSPIAVKSRRGPPRRSAVVKYNPSGDQADDHLERISTSHHCEIGGLEDCQTVVGLARGDATNSNLRESYLNLPTFSQSTIVSPNSPSPHGSGGAAPDPAPPA